MIVKKFTTDELFKLLYDTKKDRFVVKEVMTDGNFYLFKNFCYFSGHHIFEERDDFIIAYDANNPSNIFGVLKYGWYGFDEKYLAVTYIDVNIHFRHQGIAKKLMQELNNQLPKYNTQFLKLSYLSDEGKKYNIDQVFKKYITTIPVYTDEDIYEEITKLYKKG